MERITLNPRPGWRETVKDRGLVYSEDVKDDGTVSSYWHEGAAMKFEMDDVLYLESVTENLDKMCKEATRYILDTSTDHALGLSAGSMEAARASFEADVPSLYGRFDLSYDGKAPAKMLEFNADTPTGLVEAGVVQWHWLQDVFPDKDQWNSLHDRLVNQWRKIGASLASKTVHFTYHGAEESGEDWLNVTYLRDCANQAGLHTMELTLDQIGYNSGTGTFRGEQDEFLATCFKLYPWELMLDEEFGHHVMADPLRTTWLEPLWKVIPSNKALLDALWKIYPGHENLLRSHLGDPQGMKEWVAKPLHGREGDGIVINAGEVQETHGGGLYDGSKGYLYQEWNPLPSFDGNRTVLGSWVIDGKAAGVGVRESDGFVTNNGCRFIPNFIDAPAPSETDVAAMLAE